MSSHLNHDTAARLLDLTPAELTVLVGRGIIPRVDKNAYNLGPLVHSYVRHLRDETGRVEKQPTQAEIAAHLDISDRRLRELLTEFDLDHKQVPMAEIRVRYLRKLREEAAGRAAGGDLDLAGERALLAKEQRIRIEMQNAVTRKELAPVFLIEEVLAKAGSRAARILDTIPGLIRRRAPELNADILEAVQAEVSKARNLAAAVSLADLEEKDSADADTDVCTTPEDED